MSAFLEIRDDFLREASKFGWANPAEVPESWRLTLPERIMRRWLGGLHAEVQVSPSSPRRLLNHFKLGADPEFAFVGASGERTSAQDLEFRAALAWGADNNGRLAELRPEPNRHALSVTASLWSTMWWMSYFVPATFHYSWRSGAWFANDGMGGHVHFGRKRPTWAREVQALDTLAFWFQHTNILNQGEWHERIRRTRGHGNYGQLSDRRPQAHGWEYRTIPSWLDSPWLAYLILTLSKLAVFDPEYIPVLSPGSEALSVATVRNRLRGLLTYYKSRDDDAAFAYSVFLRHGWPHFDPTDFKPRWGIFGNSATKNSVKNLLVPTSIPPSSSAITELGKAMLEGRPPEFPDTSPSWTPSALPDGYIQSIVTTDTYHRPGLGELIRELVVHDSPDWISLTSSGSGTVDVPANLIPSGTGAWLDGMRRKYPELELSVHSPESGKRSRIFLPLEYATNPVRRAKLVEFLTSGWAPIWHVTQVRPDSLAKFLASVPQPVAPKPKPVASIELWPPPNKPKKKQVYNSLPRSWLANTTPLNAQDLASQAQAPATFTYSWRDETSTEEVS